MVRVLLCMLVLVAVAAVPAYGAHAPARLSLTGTTLRGTHFHARERVRIRIAAASTVVRTVRTNAGGAFTLAVLPRDPCNDALIIVAAGATGDSARLKVMPRMCPPGN